MWFWFVAFCLALVYKFYQSENILRDRVQEYIFSNSSVFVSCLCFTISLLYLRINTQDDKWVWYWYTSHAILAVVYMIASMFHRPETSSFDTLALIATGFCFGRMFEPELTPWLNLTTLCAMVGTISNRRHASLIAFCVFVGYAFHLSIHVPMPDLSGACVLVFIAMTKAISIIYTEHAVFEIRWSLILAAYNVAQLFNVPINIEDKLETDDFLTLVVVCTALALLQMMTLVWLSHTGAVSYMLGMIMSDMLFIMSGDVSTNAMYIGWLCIMVYIVVYSTYPLIQSPPPREPSVPPLPPESPKMKREDSKPSAPLDLPDPPSEVPTQGEIV